MQKMKDEKEKNMIQKSNKLKNKQYNSIRR